MADICRQKTSSYYSCHSKDTLPVSPSADTLQIAQEFFRVSRSDKHSDLRSEASVTVMAVAADFHRNFLIPERSLTADRPTTEHRARDEPCLFFCTGILYHIIAKNSRPLPRIIKKCMNINKNEHRAVLVLVLSDQ